MEREREGWRETEKRSGRENKVVEKGMFLLSYVPTHHLLLQSSVHVVTWVTE